MAKTEANFFGRSLTFDEQADQARILQWLVFLRVVLSFFILGTTYVLYAPQSLIVPYVLIGFNVIVTLVSAIFVERWAANRSFVLFQVYWDFLFVSLLVYVTGAYLSHFAFLYVLTIIFASILTSQLHTNALAVECAAVFAVMLVGQHYGVLRPVDFGDLGLQPPARNEIAVKIMLNTLAFFSAGLMASYLASRSKAADVELKRQRQAMAALKRLNENIVESLPIGMLTCDTEGRVTFANSSVATLLELDGNVDANVTLTNLLPPLETIDADHGPFDIELKEGRRGKQILSATSTALRDGHGTTVGRVVTLQDVTALRELEEVAKRADRQSAVAKLAAGIAHEIRNPLASMSGSIQLLHNELDLDPVHAHLMSIVLRETDRLNNLINDFLIYARPSERKDIEGDLSAVLEEQLGVLVNDPSCHGVRIDKNLTRDLVCRFDPNQIRQLFWNLLINAVQAMREGGVLTVTSRRSAHSKGFIEIEVADTGEGIDAVALANIFDPFFTTKEKGSGLGLTTANRIVENHGGRIAVDSAPGHGTTFKVLIPA